MRIALPVVLLLFGTLSVHAQAPTSGSPISSTVPPSAQAPVQSPNTAASAPALPDSTEPQTSARAEAATTVPQAESQQPKKRSRVVWFVVGAVVVLGIIVAMST